ncbi:unnamed protein product [Paramecium pentaurelia]|uniref:Uncharacterized protein n=1 Tax=Paramecium pentaurelia TaxID=43138 RepID=A0A8S1WYE0_9CILI|nr:unnamed protein product [Paramecium pentaurelia]
MNQGIAICYVSDLLWLKFPYKLQNLETLKVLIKLQQQYLKFPWLKFIHKIQDLAIGNDEQHDKIIKIRNAQARKECTKDLVIILQNLHQNQHTEFYGIF